MATLYKPPRKWLRKILRREELRKQPTFPPLDAPVDCYIMFSTLPDSKYV